MSPATDDREDKLQRADDLNEWRHASDTVERGGRQFGNVQSRRSYMHLLKKRKKKRITRQSRRVKTSVLENENQCFFVFDFSSYIDDDSDNARFVKMTKTTRIITFCRRTEISPLSEWNDVMLYSSQFVISL